ncbi:MAG: hypothetical protein O7H41_19485, partial [Planctomycetota bacterium]|nr:hypothetical protein [Planctomycetota bacterium]
MISADFSKVTPQADQPRVRPSIWLLMLVVGGVGLLALGHSHNWFLAAFVTGTLHNLTFFLAWALVGLAYSMLASLVWLRWGGEPGRVNRVVGLLFLVGSIMWGSQEVAHLVMDKLGVPIVQIGWDPDSQEFVVDVISTNNAVAGARMRGDLQAIVSVEGLWWSPSEKETSQPPLASEVEEFA